MKPSIGKQSMQFTEAPYLISSSSVVAKKEGDGPLGHLFDVVSEDHLFGQDTWEEAESIMQQQASELAIGRAKIKPEQVRYAFGGDLLGQLIATSFGIRDLEIPFFGLYGACSTCGEALTLGAMSVASGYADYTLAVTSSHFASAEKEFRFPLAYANQRPLSTNWTVTGSGAFVIGKIKSKVRITGATIGKIVDFGVKDSMNMGACMAPAACDSIYQHLIDFGVGPDHYDKIITGDLGYIGQRILLDLMKDKGVNISKQHTDCGIEIYNKEEQDTHSGGSGCGCSAVTLSAYILKQLETGVWKRVLFAPTGALLSTVSFNEGQSVPGICHCVALEACD